MINFLLCDHNIEYGSIVMKLGGLILNYIACIVICVIVAQQVIAVENANDTKNAVTAHHSQRKGFLDKLITSEFHRHKEAKRKPVTKHLEKKMSKISHVKNKRISKILIKGNKNIETVKLKSIIKPYLIKGVTETEAQLISKRVEKYYREQGYYLPVAHVTITGSVLKLEIIEGKIKSVLVGFTDEKRDKKVLKNKRFLDLVEKIEKADPLRTKDLERYLLLINKIHGYEVRYELKPLDEIEGNNVAELMMQVSTSRGTASVSVNNEGTDDLGKHQLNFSAQAFNVISNDSLLLTLGTSDKPKKFQLITAGYLKRLNSYGTSASIFFSHMKDDPYHKDGSKDSISDIVKFRVDQYLVLNNAHSFKLEVGAEHRDVIHYSQRLKTSDYKYVMGTVGGKIKLTDPFDIENWFFPYFNWALKRVSYKKDSKEDINFDKNFNYFTVNYHRNQPLPANFSLFLKASYQYTDKLLPREHIYSINSSNTARGYNAGLVSSDQGISGSAELRYTHEFEKSGIKKFLQTAQIFTFYDISHFIKHNKTEERKQHPAAIYFDKSSFPGAGAGLRLFLSYGFFAEGTAEFPIEKNVTVNGLKNKNKPLYRFTLSKEFNW